MMGEIMPEKPIDPLKGPSYALERKVVTMDSAFQVISRGVAYIKAGQIVAVQPFKVPRPLGFESSPLIRIRGTIYPGLIDIHNLLSYDALPLWIVPRRFSNRSQWGGKPDYRKLISGPMQVLVGDKLSVCLLGSGGEDFDLYLKRDSLPTNENYDARGYTASANEEIVIHPVQPEDYYIMVRLYSGSGDCEIKVDLEG